MHFLGRFNFFFMIFIRTTTNITSIEHNLCGDVSLSRLKFSLFTHQNSIDGITLNEDTYSSVDTNHSTTLIIHGWIQDITLPWIRLMKDTYLNKSAANIILVDWSAYSVPNYFAAVCAVPQVGRIIGDLIYNLTKIGTDVRKVQINGFSLGAHVAGAAGQRVFQLGNSKINRINGLEAAGPIFTGKPISERLDASDAVFVQAIHTNKNVFGIAVNYGTIDFVVNYNLKTCGTRQAGCPGHPGIPTDGTPFPYVFCNHIRSAAYYIESINSDKFLGVQCSGCFAFGTGKCRFNSRTVMGEMCPFDQSGVRYLNTNSRYPFAKG